MGRARYPVPKTIVAAVSAGRIWRALMSDFSDEVVLVTGGTRGIGRGLVKAFARAGAKVALCGRGADAAAEAADAVAKKTSATVIGVQADISSSDDVDRMIAEVGEKLGPIRVLVNNAGITKDALLLRMKNEQWEEVIGANLTGTFYCSRAVAKGMLKERYGRIVNISSIVGVHGQAGQANYAAAKSGLIGFTKSLAQEFAKRNVTANVIAPGYFITDMTSGLGEAAHGKFIERIPVGREGSIEELAHSVMFLASKEASYITGQVLSVDGGMGM